MMNVGLYKCLAPVLCYFYKSTVFLYANSYLLNALSREYLIWDEVMHLQFHLLLWHS